MSDKTPSLGTEMNRHLQDREIAITGKRFCTNCQKQQHAHGGVVRRSRWLCAACEYRRKHRILG